MSELGVFIMVISVVAVVMTLVYTFVEGIDLGVAGYRDARSLRALFAKIGLCYYHTNFSKFGYCS